MQHPKNPIFFRSTLFCLEPGEEEEINPGRYGRHLANWLRDQLSRLGYTEAKVDQEDWGRRIVVFTQPYEVSIGCGNMDDEPEDDYDPYASPERITWHCFVEGKPPLLNRLFGKSNTPLVDEVEAKLRTLLERTPGITMVSVDKL
jgi:hypothetical protein